MLIFVYDEMPFVIAQLYCLALRFDDIGVED